MEPKTSVTAAVAVSLLSLSLTVKLIILAGAIFMGANSYAIVSLRAAKKENQAFSKLDYLGSVMVAAFSGGMFFFAAVSTTDDWVIAWIAGGMGAFMGITGISKLGEALIEMLTNRVSNKK